MSQNFFRPSLRHFLNFILKEIQISFFLLLIRIILSFTSFFNIHLKKKKKNGGLVNQVQAQVPFIINIHPFINKNIPKGSMARYLGKNKQNKT